MPEGISVCQEQQWREVLWRATQNVMETMFFTTINGDASPEQTMGNARTAQLSFEGDPSGIFAVSISLNSARQIAANFLGVEDAETLDETQIDDVVCEMANMLCGSVLSGVRSGAHFDLAHPELIHGEADPPAGALCSHLELEDGMLTSWLLIVSNSQ